MPQFPPLPRVHFDPFGSLTSGYLMGSELAMKRSQHELERAKAEVELRDRLAKQMALQQYADTGDISYLRRYSPEVEHGIRLSQAQEQIQRLHGAREYMITVLPFLTRSQVPQLYKTLQERFGIDTSGWSVPETDEQFEIAKQQLWGRLTGKSEGGHVLSLI
ncbi:MAG: hypothetical protein N3E40_01540, partial [Dehalococcoidia bacterium]|nr:hypothetical protein [Dehalococcoidia bacterium]